MNLEMFGEDAGGKIKLPIAYLNVNENRSILSDLHKMYKGDQKKIGAALGYIALYMVI